MSYISNKDAIRLMLETGDQSVLQKTDPAGRQDLVRQLRQLQQQIQKKAAFQAGGRPKGQLFPHGTAPGQAPGDLRPGMPRTGQSFNSSRQPAPEPMRKSRERFPAVEPWEPGSSYQDQPGFPRRRVSRLERGDDE